MACFWPLLIFDPNWRFCKVYSLCKMADFQNGLFSRIFGVLSKRFFAHKEIYNVLVRIDFSQLFLAILIFDFETDHLTKSIAFARWPIFKIVSFPRIIGVFLQRIFAQNNSNVLVESFLACFWPTLIFDPNWPFCKVYSLWQDGRFSKSSHFSNIWCCFQWFFRTKEI